MNREVVMARALLRDLKTIPNIISISRIVLLGICIAVFYLTEYELAIFIGVIGGITDYFDGILLDASIKRLSWVPSRTNMRT